MRLRSLCAVILGSIMLAGNASALSCMPSDLIKTLEDAKASEKLYYILVGNFTPLSPLPKREFNEGYISPEDQFKSKPPVITQSHFQGYSLAQDPRRDAQLSRFPVDIETSCVGPWCSAVPSSSRDIIAFVEMRDGQAPLLKTSACPYWTFSAEANSVEKLRECLDKTCKSETPNW